jgi:hypothetical protein
LKGGCGGEGGWDGVPEVITCLQRYCPDRLPERWGMRRKLLVYIIINNFCFYILPLKASATEIFDESHIVWNPPRRSALVLFQTWHDCKPKDFLALSDSTGTVTMRLLITNRYRFMNITQIKKN